MTDTNENAAFYSKVKTALTGTSSALELGIVKTFWFDDSRFRSLPKGVRDDLEALHAREYRRVSGALVG